MGTAADVLGVVAECFASSSNALLKMPCRDSEV
jgi:hypothetical protein